VPSDASHGERWRRPSVPAFVATVDRMSTGDEGEPGVIMRFRADRMLDIDLGQT
jgi:hypothetical protein